MRLPDVRITTARLGATLSVAAVFAAQAAAPAATPASAAAASAAASAAKAPLLTQAQLRDCLARRDKMRTDADEIAAEKTQLDKDRAELQATIAALQARAATVDRKNKADIDTYNADSAEGNRQIALMDARIKTFNVKADGLGSAQDAYEADCVNKSYDARDALPEKPH